MSPAYVAFSCFVCTGCSWFHIWPLILAPGCSCCTGLPQWRASRITGIIKGQRAVQKMGLVLMRTVWQRREKHWNIPSIETKFYTFWVINIENGVAEWYYWSAFPTLYPWNYRVVLECSLEIYCKPQLKKGIIEIKVSEFPQTQTQHWCVFTVLVSYRFIYFWFFYICQSVCLYMPWRFACSTV